MAARLRLLGSPTLERDGESQPLAFERRTQLLAYLALKGGWVGRAELAALLWPEQPEKLAYTNLRKTIFRLRSFAWAPQVETQGSALRYAPATDVGELEAALRDNRADAAARIGGGRLMAGYDDDANDAWTGWLAYERERLHAAWRGAVLASLSGDVAPESGLALCARLLEIDPLDEAALRAQMAFHARAGNLAQARLAYREFAARLANELALEPPAELKAFHDSLSGARPPPASAARNLPDDGFIGRSVEIRQAAALLSQPDCRIVTLIGPGGVGKTRLGQRILTDLGAAYPDGAAFVPLEEATVSGDITSGIARALGLALAPRRDPLVQLAEHLSPRRMLLLLDNFEHLTAHAALLGQLAQRCPEVKWLVTSRARLGLPAEQLLPLEGLPVPDAEDHDRFEAFDAVRLFIKAARRVEPGLVPEAEAAAIVDICRQVDGLPLAIELAASWARVLSCEAIASQLRDGLQLLRAADPGRPARHASMQVVFDESWRVLGEAERNALLRLSVFEGGFSAEAAQSVAGASLPVLGALMDRSMLRKDAARLHLHPLLQQLAAERLQREGLADEALQAHARYFQRMMASLGGAVGRGEPEALRTLDRELSNCRAAWRRAARHGPASALRGSVFTLLHYCDHRFRLEEALGLITEAIDGNATRADAGLGPLLHATAAHMRYRLDRYAEAEAEALAALAALNGQPHRHETRLQCVKVLGGCCLRTGRLEESRRWFREALELALEHGELGSAAGMLDNLAIVEKRLGHYDEALRLGQQALLQHRGAGDIAGEALCLNNLGTLCVDREEYDAARGYLTETLVLCEKHGLTNTRTLATSNLVEVEVAAGHLDAAEARAREALELAISTGARAVEAAVRLDMVRVALRRKDLGAARGQLAAGVEIALSIGSRYFQYIGLLRFAELLEAQGDAGASQSLLEYCIGRPDIGAPERDAMRAHRDGSPAQAWKGPDVQALLHRIVVEKDLGHAPLLAALGD